jgi:hypothetical protein
MQTPADPDEPQEPGQGYGGDPYDDGVDDEFDDDLEHITHRSEPRQPAPKTALTDRPESNPTGLTTKVWHPEPVEAPRVDPDLTRMSWPERAAEVIRFSALRLERWVSAKGALREWLRLNLRIGIVVLAVALLVVPPVSLLLRGTSEWSVLLKSTLLNVSDTVMALPPIVIALGALLIGGRFLQRRWMGRKRRPNYREHDPYDM